MSIFSCCTHTGDHHPDNSFFEDKSDPIVIDMYGRKMVFPGHIGTHEAMKIALLFSQELFQQTEINLFVTSQDLTSSHTKDETGYHFFSPLLYSERSAKFIHGSSILPGLYDGGEKFLTQRGEQLTSIQKVRFKKKITGNIHYTITEDKDDLLEKDASVYATLKNNSGTLFYMYGIDQPHPYPPQFVTKNILSELLLSDISSESVRLLSQKINQQKYPLQVPLQSLGGNYYEGYKDIIEKNPGFFWSTMADILNHIFQLKMNGSGLVMSYEDLKFTESYAPEKLLDGNCTVICTMENANKSIGEKGYGHMTTFQLIDNTHQPIATGKITFFTTSVISET